MDTSVTANRLVQAERRGLRLAIFCRTVAVAAALAWFVAGSVWVGYSLNPLGVAALLAFTVLGVVHLAIIGTRFDRWWLKFAVYAVDILGICALFALVPPSRNAEVPQIIVFRAYGIYYLFPLIALACLSLSWRLVAWSGFVAVVGWWATFAVVVGGMERRLSWGDLPEGAGREDYEAIFLSIDFIGTGNRVEETGLLFIAALVLALAVFRARRVFFAQIAAEAEREAERNERERITLTLGRYVPEAVAAHLIRDDAALAPHVRHGAVLVLDIRDFTSFASARDPAEVIAALNEFLSRCAEIVSAHDGVVISFTGDGLLAAFNAPLDIADPEGAAVQAARALRSYAGGTAFRVRIGVAAGPLAAGSVGTSKRQAFTVYGDTVNRAARLESLAKDLGTDILVDATVAESANVRANARSLGSHSLKGMSSPVPVWTVSDT